MDKVHNYKVSEYCTINQHLITKPGSHIPIPNCSSMLCETSSATTSAIRSKTYSLPRSAFVGTETVLMKPFWRSIRAAFIFVPPKSIPIATIRRISSILKCSYVIFSESCRPFHPVFSYRSFHGQFFQEVRGRCPAAQFFLQVLL